MSDQFTDLFAPEPAPALVQSDAATWKVLLVDDEPDIHAVLRLALQDSVVLGRSLTLIDARSAAEAQTCLAEHPDIALVLLDVVMESEQAGLELVGHIRRTQANRRIQIVLVTGQPGYAPQRSVVTDYDINGYRLKSELTTDKIFVSVYTALRTHQVLLELEQNEQQLRLAASVFANSQEGLTITDANNCIIDVNKSFERITGYSREDVIGQNPKMLRSGRQGDAFYADMWRDLNDRSSWRGEIWNRRKSGEIFAEILSIDAVRDDQGQISHYVGAFTDISQIKEHQAELERIANFDTLTGLPNRRLLADRLGQELARARRSGRPLAICYLDLDGFKPVNDQFGHEVGDRVLIEISQRLLTISRAGDTVARLGGDEFVLLFGDLAQAEECYPLLERVLATIATPITLDSHAITVGASIGVTLFPRDDADADTLMRHADQAMYQAKEAGKSRFHVFDAEHDRQTKTNRESYQRLEQALTQDEFELFYQPKVNMTNGEVIGAEALIRWRHPERGLLSPAEFLPLMSGTELEISLGEWVIEHALRQIEEWGSGCATLVISVNISANQLLRPNFLPRLSEALLHHPNIPPNRLELEVLESAAIDDLPNAARTLASCIGLGMHFALDDFGTGYSSLTYFRKLPVGTLKIDQGFVRGMLDDPEDLGIIESVVGLARAFNRPVIAEGVETLDHGAMLVMLGCALGQGYGIARPMPAVNLPAWVAQWRGEDIWQTLSNYALPGEDLGLIVAQRSHQRWFDDLKTFLDSQNAALPPAMLPTQCPFGRWFHGNGLSRYGHFPDYADIGALHVDIHNCAAEACTLLAQNQRDQALLLIPQLTAMHEALTSSFENLITKVTVGAVPPAPTFDQ